MNLEEKGFLKKSVIELIKNNNSVKLNQIIDYLDFINKVNYSKSEVSTLLHELVLENNIYFEDPFFKIKR